MRSFEAANRARIQQAKWQRGERERRKAAGLCTWFGCRSKARPERVTCEEHSWQGGSGQRPPTVLVDEHHGYLATIARIDAKLSAQGRCKCGLLLPCESCLPTIQELAITRPGSGEAYPEAAEGLGISGAERGRDSKRPRGPAGRVSPGR